jgi:prephenate dehydrogenase
VDHTLRGLIGDLEAMRESLAADPAGLLTPVVAAAGDLRRAWPPAGGPACDLPVSVDGLLALGRAGGWVTAVAENRANVRAMRPETVRNAA